MGDTPMKTIEAETLLAERPGPGPEAVWQGDMDLAAAERAVGDLLSALGQDTTDPNLRDTPRRVAAAYRELLTPKPFNLTTFPNEEGYDQLIIARSIRFTSLCAHHLLPFTGTASVGY